MENKINPVPKTKDAKKPKGRPGELPMDFKDTPIGIAAAELKTLRDEADILDGKISSAKISLLKFMKEKKHRSITAAGLKLTIKPSADVLEVKNA